MKIEMHECKAKWHDLTNPAPFKNLYIQLPEKLETEEDFTRLFHYMISEYCEEINLYQKQFGFGDRQRLLVYILQSLKVTLPKAHPEYIAAFPESLDNIRNLIAYVVIMSMDYTGMHPEEDGIEEQYRK